MKPERHKSRLLSAVHETARDLHKLGVMLLTLKTLEKISFFHKQGVMASC